MKRIFKQMGLVLLLILISSYVFANITGQTIKNEFGELANLRPGDRFLFKDKQYVMGASSVDFKKLQQNGQILITKTVSASHVEFAAELTERKNNWFLAGEIMCDTSGGDCAITKLEQTNIRTDEKGEPIFPWRSIEIIWESP